jgi:hypothetical protein
LGRGDGLMTGLLGADADSCTAADDANEARRGAGASKVER